MRRCFILLLGLAATPALAQTPNPPLRVIPPPPNFAADAASGRPAHHATQSAIDPEHAFDPITGESFSWDCARRSWINSRTNDPIGFAGQSGVNGEVIPPPPFINGNPPQTTSADPDHAVEPKTGTNLVWDRNTKTWRDSKTNRDVGFQGVVLRDTCPSTHAAVVQISPRNRPAPQIRFDKGISGEKFLAGAHYDYRSFYKFKDIVSSGPLATSNDVTSAANGVGGFIGVKLPILPAFGTIDGYWSTGLMTNVMLSNGHRAQSDIDDYGAGLGIRLMPSGRRRVTPYGFANALYEWNKSTYQEFNTAGTLSFTEERRHTTWTGEYGVGAALWFAPQIGISTEASYNGIFKSTNANENFKLSAGLTLRLGGR